MSLANKKPQKPLRKVVNKAKDIYNAYGSQESNTMSKNTQENEMKETVDSEATEVMENEAQEIEVEIEEPVAQEEEVIEESSTDLEKENLQLRDQVARKIAEMENIRRRTEQEKKDIIKYANTKLLAQLLPFVDNLSRAVESGKKSQDYEALLSGVEMIYNNTMNVLKETGVEPIDTKDAMFDVNLHAAMMQQPSDEPEGKILQELEKGYTYNEKVLRHSKVITSAGS